jgi:imidazoleglycerol-phosphate dehydratase
MMGRAELIAEIDKVRPPYNISVLNCECALFALEHAEVFAEQAATLRREAQPVAGGLARMARGQGLDSDANMILVRVPDALKTFRRHALLGVLIKNVSKMHPLLANCLRLTVGSRRQHACWRLSRPLYDLLRTVPAACERTAEVTRNTTKRASACASTWTARARPAQHRHRLFRPHARPDRPPRPDRPRHRMRGDLHIDGHHTVEDVGITLGQALAKAIGDKKGIRRYGHAYVPLDEALSRVVVDFSGARPAHGREVHRRHDRRFRHAAGFEFFQGFVNHAGVTLHIDNLKGVNAHHQCETIFKAFGRALRWRSSWIPAGRGIPTKGALM